MSTSTKTLHVFHCPSVLELNTVTNRVIRSVISLDSDTIPLTADIPDTAAYLAFRTAMQDKLDRLRDEFDAAATTPATAKQWLTVRVKPLVTEYLPGHKLEVHTYGSKEAMKTEMLSIAQGTGSNASVAEGGESELEALEAAMRAAFPELARG